jgi:hypothetical protein
MSHFQPVLNLAFWYVSADFMHWELFDIDKAIFLQATLVIKIIPLAQTYIFLLEQIIHTAGPHTGFFINWNINPGLRSMAWAVSRRAPTNYENL